jgi:hypothetical protein
LRCPKYGFEANRDTIAVMNIERIAISKMGGPLATSTAPQMTDVSPNRCGEPMSRPKETLALQGGKEVSHGFVAFYESFLIPFFIVVMAMAASSAIVVMFIPVMNA